jgi:hypothetical protein
LVTTRRSNFCFSLTIFWTSASTGRSVGEIMVLGW